MQADQLVRSIELFQLLQIRLAGESLFFLPLPFSFLDQGYLLVDADQGRDPDRQGDEQAHPRYELHLRRKGSATCRSASTRRTAGWPCASWPRTASGPVSWPTTGANSNSG